MEMVLNIETSLNANFANEIEVQTAEINPTQNIINFLKIPNIAIDLTLSPSCSVLLKKTAENLKFVIISQKREIGIVNDWEFLIHISISDKISALNNIINYLGWEKFIVIHDENNYYFCRKWKSEFPTKIVNFFHFANNATQDSADLFIGKTIKPIGIRNFIILNSGSSTQKIIKSLKSKNLLTTGSGVLLGTEILENIKADGILAFTESELENATDSYSYEFLAIQKIIKNVLSFPSYYDSFSLREFLETNMKNHSQIPKFSFINIQNQQKILVGTIENENLNLNKNAIWPGNSTTIPNSPYTNITISLDDGVNNPNGQPPNAFTRKSKEGSIYSFMYIKEIHFFDNFEILVTHTECGADVYNATYNLNCFRQLKDQLGVGFITSSLGLLVVGNIISLRTLNISIPHISDYAMSHALTPKNTFPEFMRVAKDSEFNAAVIIKFCAIYGWSNIIAIYENNAGPTFAYNQLENQAKLHNINIVNTPDQRKVKAGYHHTDYDSYKPWMQNYIKSKVRIYVVFISNPSRLYFFEDLYDAGIRRGKILFLFYDWAMTGFDYETDPVQMYKLRELFYGCLIITQAEWTGEFGQKLKKSFMEAISYDTQFRCFSFDASMLLFHGIRYTLDHGGNLENSTLLNANIRAQKFVGCSGVISIDPESNDRSSNIMGIYNVIENKTSGAMYENLAGRYDLDSIQLFTFWDEIIWYDNTTNVPTDIINYDDCSFDDNLVKYNLKGAGILYAISLSILITASTIIAVNWKIRWNFPFDQMTEKSLIQFEDYVEMLIIIIDFFQFIAVGPDISEYDEFSSTLASYGTMHFGPAAKGRAFWMYVYSSFLGVLASVYFSAHIIFNLGKFNNWFFSYSETFVEKALPILGNIAILPIIYILLSVIQCDQGIGSDLTQSFPHNDCSVFCWKGNHITWAVLAVISLFIYLPLSLYSRHKWENISKQANIQVQPLFLLLKTLFQVSIIISNKTLKTNHQSLHGLVFILLLLSFTGICYKKKPYNYNRCNLWVIISYLAVLWSVSLSTIYWLLSSRYGSIWLLIQWLGWLTLFVVGLIIQQKYCPGLLYTEKAPDIGLLFRFSLGRSVAACDIIKSKSGYFKSINEASSCVLSGEQIKEKFPEDISCTPMSVDYLSLERK